MLLDYDLHQAISKAGSFQSISLLHNVIIYIPMVLAAAART